MSRLTRILRKPPHVILFRGKQELASAWLKVTRGWQRLEAGIDQFWTPQQARSFLHDHPKRIVLISSDAPFTLREVVALNLLEAKELLDYGGRIFAGDLKVFGVEVPEAEPYPWHTDWRIGYTWTPTYFKSYNFYETRSAPYDVKFPWELSRLGFILPMVQNFALDGDTQWLSSVRQIVQDWEKDNPLAHSIAWYPMEVSIRGINLVTAFEMLVALNWNEIDTFLPLLRLITKHGEFLYRNIEYSDVRGNHFAANLVALLLMGVTLKDVYPIANRWFRYAATMIPDEIMYQFTPDGVHIEKSVAYHRLVLELFMHAAIVMDRCRISLPHAVASRLHAACRYSALITKPDGLAPNVGDNDSARIYELDATPASDHRPVITVGALRFRDTLLESLAEPYPVVFWLLGREALGLLSSPSKSRGIDDSNGSFYLSDGGVVVSRKDDNFLWVDVGEIGLHGRGGHGHNDTLSFELVLRGHPLVIDPGSYTYTGDPELHRLFRSTAYHNSMRVDGQEMAEFEGFWGITNEAQPYHVTVEHERGSVVIEAVHRGYHRLPDPVTHQRRFAFDGSEGKMICEDDLCCSANHRIERFLHLHPKVQVELSGERALLCVDGHRWVVSWDEKSMGRLEVGWVCPGYSQRLEATILVIESVISSSCRLHFSIESLFCT